MSNLVALVAVGTDNVKDSTAFSILSKNKTPKERAEKYAERISKNLKSDLLESLERKIEDIEDKIFGLSDISLKTNVNEGIKQVSQEQVERNFSEIIELSYRRDLLVAEYNSKAKAFNSLFSSTKDAAVAEEAAE